MQSKINKFTAKKSKKGHSKGKGKGQASKVSHGSYNTNPHYARALVPKLPRELEFSSMYSTYDIRLANTTPAVRIFGLIDFYNQLPAYAASFYQIYKYARINAITLHVELVTTGTEPMIIAADILPYTQANSTAVDPHFIASRPRAISRICGASAGMSRVTLNRTYKTAESLGQLNYSDSAWQSYSEALSVIPDPDHPFLCISMDSVNAAGIWGADAAYRITYHMQFFELQDPSLTMTPEEYQEKRHEQMESMQPQQRVQSSKQSCDDSFRTKSRR
jgi:hypothetical protein